MGWSGQAVTASRVFVSGGGGVIDLNPQLEAMLFYSPAEALGDLLMSLAVQAGVDEAGNAFPQGLHLAADAQMMPAMEDGWTTSAHATYTVDPLGNLVVSFKHLTPGTTTDGTRLWPAGTLVSPYVVPDNRRVVCYTDVTNGDTSAALEFEADGGVACYGIGATATRVDLFAVIPIMF